MDLTIQQLIQSGYTYSWINTNNLSEGVIFYDAEGNFLHQLDGTDYDLSSIIDGTISIGDYARNLFSEHLETAGLWTGEEYVQKVDKDDTWNDLWNQHYVDPAEEQASIDEMEEAGMGTFKDTGFDYSQVPNPKEYGAPPKSSKKPSAGDRDVNWSNVTFKQYLDNEFGSSSLSGALLSAGTAKEQMQLLGYEGEPEQIDLLGLGQLYSGMAEENLKKAMFTEVLSQKGGNPLSEEDIKFFADLGAPEFESRLNLIKQQKTTREQDAFRNLERTKDDIGKAEEDVRGQLGDLPSRLEDSLIGGDVAFARAGASELGYGGATEAREGLSEKTQEASEMESKELRKALEDLGIAGARATEDYESQLAQLDQSLKGGLLDITSGIRGEVSGAQNLVTSHVANISNKFASADTLAQLVGADGEGALDSPKMTLTDYRSWR